MSYRSPLEVLSNVRIASPCTADWAGMVGDEKKRHCAQCDLDVFNFSAMSAEEAAALAERAADGRVCARFYRRADGTMLLADCPVGIAALRKRLRAGVARAAGAAIVLVAASLAFATGKNRLDPSARVRRMQPFAWLVEKLNPSAAQIAVPVMGEICVPVPPATSSPAPSANN